MFQVKLNQNQKAVRRLQYDQLCRLVLSPMLSAQQKCRKYKSDNTNPPLYFTELEPFAEFVFKRYLSLCRLTKRSLIMIGVFIKL